MSTDEHDRTSEARSALLASLDAFTAAYLECALWSSTDNSDDSGGEPLDDEHDLESFDLPSLESAIKDCASFQESESGALKAAYATRGYGGPEQAGHDFWLTRNGHGAGFWDRGIGVLGDRLSKAAKVYGSVDLMACEGVVSGS